jgi:hypothetical protein
MFCFSSTHKSVFVFRETTNFIYVQETIAEGHGYPRGSVPSIRKGSYDLKSINSDGKYLPTHF